MIFTCLKSLKMGLLSLEEIIPKPLKIFSAFVHHMSGLNWHKNFGYCSTIESAVPSSMQKLWTPLATKFLEKKFWRKIWCGSRPIQVTLWKDFLISWKKWCFQIFRTALLSRASVVHDLASVHNLRPYDLFSLSQWLLFFQILHLKIASGIFR